MNVNPCYLFCLLFKTQMIALALLIIRHTRVRVEDGQIAMETSTGGILFHRLIVLMPFRVHAVKPKLYSIQSQIFLGILELLFLQVFCFYIFLLGLRHSAILGNDNGHLRTLCNWLKPVVQSKSSYWNRCWRASLDGWASTTFHSLCDNKGPTVTIIRVGQYIFGGYTSASWSK